MPRVKAINRTQTLMRVVTVEQLTEGRFLPPFTAKIQFFHTF
jgi:hypothetical protein